jgi:hypothetical protein
MARVNVLFAALAAGVVCTVLLAIVAVGGQASPGAPAGAIVIDDTGFSSPQAALQRLVDGLTSGNYYDAADACATVSLADHINWTAYEAYYGSWDDGNGYMPSQYPYWQQANSEFALNRCLFSLRALAEKISDPGLASSLIGGVYTGPSQKLATELNPQALGNLRLIRFDQVLVAGVALRDFGAECAWYGSRNCVSGLALLTAGGTDWVLGPTFVQYDGEWRIADVVGFAGGLLGIPADAGLQVPSQAAYDADLKTVRNLALSRK